jgi:hypothetical protein
MPSRRYLVWTVDQESGQVSCMPTKGCDYQRCRRYLQNEALRHASPASGSKAVTDWATIVGWANELTPGSQASVNCASGSNAGRTFTLRSFRWPLPLSAHALWMTCVSDSNEWKYCTACLAFLVPVFDRKCSGESSLWGLSRSYSVRLHGGYSARRVLQTECGGVQIHALRSRY